MNLEEIKKVITDQREDWETLLKKERIIQRDVPSDRMISMLSRPNILALLGVRRCGKSVLALSLLEGKTYGYVNFDDERLAGIQAKNLNGLLEAFYELYGRDLDTFVLDEIQNIDGWELFVTRLRRTKKVIITGSNANLLSEELSTHLTGRHVDFTLYPFSFREFLAFRESLFTKEDLYSTANIATVKKLLDEYLELGGFPEAYTFGRAILSRIYGDIINKDVVNRYRIRHVSIFREMAKYLVSNFGKEQSFNKLKSVFSIKHLQTVRNYADYLASSHLIFFLERFSFKLKHQFIAPRKVYCIDTGIINSIAFQLSENRGRLIENAVAVELLRRKSYFDNTEIYYWKDHSGREVDFVIKEGPKVTSLVQVCYYLQDAATKEREIKALIRAGEELGCKELIVVTWETQGEEKPGHPPVRYVPLWKFLLQG